MGDQTDQPAAPPSGNKKWIALACCGCLALAAIPAGFMFIFGAAGFGAYKAVQAAVAPARATVEAFLAQTSAGDAAGAYAHFTDELKKVQDLETFKAAVEKNPDLFKVHDPHFPSMNLNNGHVRLAGTVTNEKGEAKRCTFELIEQGGDWKLLEYNISNE